MSEKEQHKNRKIVVTTHAFKLYCEDCDDLASHKFELNGMVTVECKQPKYCKKTVGM